MIDQEEPTASRPDTTDTDQKPSCSRIFVDGECLVCSLEVRHYENIAKGTLEIIDISSPNFDAQSFQLDEKNTHRYFHVQKPDGTFAVGVDAFIYLWDVLPQYRFLARIAKNKFVRSVLELGYRIFVIVRPYLPKRPSPWQNKLK